MTKLGVSISLAAIAGDLQYAAHNRAIGADAANPATWRPLPGQRRSPSGIAWARQWLDGGQIAVLIAIRQAVDIITAEVSVRGPSLERLDGTRRYEWTPHQSAVVRAYEDWVDAMALLGKHISPVRDLAVDDLTLKQIQRARRMGHRAVVRAIKDGISLWGELARGIVVVTRWGGKPRLVSRSYHRADAWAAPEGVVP